jgi:excisionase family DNA binding protein
MDRLLTAEELAEQLGMKTDWVGAQARAGRIPHVRLGRYRRHRVFGEPQTPALDYTRANKLMDTRRES